MTKERRGARRRPILDSFSCFVVVPKKGPHRLTVYDLSDTGVGFDFDIEGENAADFPVKAGETHELHFYLNQSLYVPLTIRVMRMDDSKVIRRIGAEFVTSGNARSASGVNAVLAFLRMIDEISEAVQFDATPQM